MSNITVTWGRRSAIAHDEEIVRTMTREFGSAKKAAEFACDVLFVLYGPDVSNARSEKFYTVARDRPLVEHMNNTRDEWVRVEYVTGASGGGGKNSI